MDVERPDLACVVELVAESELTTVDCASVELSLGIWTTNGWRISLIASAQLLKQAGQAILCCV